MPVCILTMFAPYQLRVVFLAQATPTRTTCNHTLLIPSIFYVRRGQVPSVDSLLIYPD